MTSLPITPPSAARVDAARKGSAPPSGSAGDFAALLDQTSARTASAEGPKTRPAQTEPRRRDAAAPKDDGKDAVAPEAQIAVVDPQAPPAPPAGAPQPAADGTSVEAPQGQTPPVGGEIPAAAVPAPVADPAVAAAATAVLSTAGTPAPPVATVGVSSAPATATAQAAVLTTAPPAAPEGAPAPGADAAPTDGKLQIPAELLHATKGETQGKEGKKDESAKRELPPAPTLPPTADAAATPAPGAPAATPAPQVDPAAATPAPAPALATQAQPAATAQTAVPVEGGTPQLTRASVLQTAERVHELVRIATTRAGNARATLQLRPAELGQVDVHLRTTRDGLVATIAAHDQVGLDALQQAGNELRRSLEDKGVVLHSLDLQLGSGERGFANPGDAREASSGRRGASSSHDLGGESPADDDLTLTTTASSARAGALVDVQA